MQFIAISDEVLINPERISVIEKRKIKGQEKIVITIEGQQHIVENDFGDFYAKLITAGVSASDQFFAG